LLEVRSVYSCDCFPQHPYDLICPITKVGRLARECFRTRDFLLKICCSLCGGSSMNAPPTTSCNVHHDLVVTCRPDRAVRQTNTSHCAHISSMCVAMPCGCRMIPTSPIPPSCLNYSTKNAESHSNAGGVLMCAISACLNGSFTAPPRLYRL
jgi:hypothetical protein